VVVGPNGAGKTTLARSPAHTCGRRATVEVPGERIGAVDASSSGRIGYRASSSSRRTVVTAIDLVKVP
jgi:ABC-type cobalamin/Fe3+-siderophores transport system ATPase subunit